MDLVRVGYAGETQRRTPPTRSSAGSYFPYLILMVSCTAIVRPLFEGGMDESDHMYIYPASYLPTQGIYYVGYLVLES